MFFLAVLSNFEKRKIYALTRFASEVVFLVPECLSACSLPLKTATESCQLNQGTCSISPLVVPDVFESLTGAACVIVVSGSVVMTVSASALAPSCDVLSFLQDVSDNAATSNDAQKIVVDFFMA